MQTLYRGNEKVILFKVRDADGDPVDLTAITDIKACLQTQSYAIGVAPASRTQVVAPATNGEFEVVVNATDSALLDTGNSTVIGQIEFGTTTQPIEYKEAVTVKDKPC
jgi:hypothetical protein